MSAEPIWDTPTSSEVASPVRTRPSLRLTEPDSGELAAASTTTSSDSSKSTTGSSTPPAQSGSSSRTPPGFSSPTTDETWPPSSAGWKTSGMGGRTGRWTRDISERPSDAHESSWSAIVEETPESHGPFWVTPLQAETLIPRIQSGGDRVDPVLLGFLHLTRSSSGASQPDPEQP